MPERSQAALMHAFSPSFAGNDCVSYIWLPSQRVSFLALANMNELLLENTLNQNL